MIPSSKLVFPIKIFKEIKPTHQKQSHKNQSENHKKTSIFIKNQDSKIKQHKKLNQLNKYNHNPCKSLSTNPQLSFLLPWPKKLKNIKPLKKYQEAKNPITKAHYKYIPFKHNNIHHHPWPINNHHLHQLRSMSNQNHYPKHRKRKILIFHKTTPFKAKKESLT